MKINQDMVKTLYAERKIPPSIYKSIEAISDDIDRTIKNDKLSEEEIEKEDTEYELQ